MLSKKHYIEFAGILKENDSKENITEALILYFLKDNERFDEEKFRRAIQNG